MYSPAEAATHSTDLLAFGAIRDRVVAISTGRATVFAVITNRDALRYLRAVTVVVAAGAEVIADHVTVATARAIVGTPSVAGARESVDIINVGKKLLHEGTEGPCCL
jgi:hypothetical protein